MGRTKGAHGGRANAEGTNRVVLEGRLTGVQSRDMPSGDEVVVFRVVVERPARERGPAGRVRVDALDCVAWRADVRRRVLRAAGGEGQVRVEGALRRRFWASGASRASRVEVEVRSVTSLN